MSNEVILTTPRVAYRMTHPYLGKAVAAWRAAILAASGKKEVANK